MFNFASLFNQFRSQSNSGLNDLLQQPNIPVGRLLEEDSFIGEFKSGNPRVMEFMKYDKYKELIDYVTVVGPADDKKRSYKYPFAACEILSLDHQAIIEFFFPENTLTVEQTTVEEVEVQEEVEIEDQPQSTQPSQEPSQASTVAESSKTQNNDEKETAGAVAQEKEQPKDEEPKKTEENTSEEKTSESTEEAKFEEKATVEQKKTEEESLYPDVSEQSTLKKPKTEIRKVKKHTEKTISRQVEPLIDQLMSYFKTEVNYTLAGYVCKILTAFFNKKPAEFLKYILQEENSRPFLDHCESRSVGELIIKILTHESTMHLQDRISFFKLVLERLSSSSEIYVMSNLSSYVCEVIEKIAANLKSNNKVPQLQEAFFSLEVITQVIKNVMSSQEQVSIYNAPILFAYLTNMTFVLPEDPQIISDFKALLQEFVDKSVDKLQVSSRERPKLGTGRVKIVEIMRFILKEGILGSREIVAKNESFFPTLLLLVREYQWNNLLHNQVIKIIEVALNEPEDSPLNAALLKDGIISKFILEETKEDRKIKAGDSIYKTRKGFIAHVTNLALKMRELAEKNSKIKEIVEDSDFAEVYESFVEKEIFKNRKTLAGYSMRRDVKHQILFQKEDIIATYATFLQKCPSPIFDTEPEHVNIEHPDLIEQLQKQLNDLSVKPKEDEGQLSAEAAAVASVQKIGHSVYQAEAVSPGYWQVHLNYNVDDLMADL